MTSFVSLIVRLIAGSLIAGHGAQKLFGWFEGPGLENWTKATESMGMVPARFYGPAGAVGEFGGGLLTALGLLNPLGPIAMMTMMVSAALKAHRGKPIWAAKGGAELPLSFFASAAAIAVHGPGSISLDSAFGIRLPRWVSALAVGAGIGAIVSAARPEYVGRFVGGSKSEPGTEQA